MKTKEKFIIQLLLTVAKMLAEWDVKKELEEIIKRIRDLD